MSPTHDVIVIGLGGMGSAAAHHLSARGARVLGLEKFGPVHDRGSSHGGSRITRQSYFEDPAYVPLLLRAYELYEDLERATGRDIALLCGGVMVGRPDSWTVSGSLRSARAWDLPHEMLDAREIRRRFPTLAPADDEVALYEARAGLLRPENTVAAHLQLATRQGADLHFEEPVTRWEPYRDGVRVHTADHTYTAGQLVICPGAWAPRLLTDLAVPFTVERQVMYWFRPRNGVHPFLPDRQPIYVWEDATGVQVYGFPAIDGPGGGAKVAFFRKGRPTTPETIDRTVHDDEVTAMADHMSTRIPDLPGTFLKAATCMYTTTADEHFVIARHPAHPGSVTVACGFSGHGFKFVPVVGEILADLALTGTTAHPIGLFDPTRLTAAPTGGAHA
ncbi:MULTISPECIES: N-methyl-L-tryptophan oxidase [Streptomyces]|uniref:Monomeric sarcosine oxidase n=2 Tax=Streptomyces rochei group TaxID=2867164 RepID=A0ABY6BPW7_9ACTN|nr:MULTISPECIES: N-methyl-L-tryptophan oxidase [Streptomyces]WDI17312.1 N-methyl-L-tryptophan oxidase [Streptomyces enissocaesilis]MBJ6618645.1 N-methyl-L-tryptophan oxidase [Streptomyces sp. DHE17-7]MBQ0882496.1 N-methyl-L-tryptophan oxidase [Streptomyces sp. RT42]MBQ0913725.1 N-methyl-L-tryptophan oxidase [Streptomyces sp. RM99]MBU8548563.1 N-methyl-L-tryptophan oxidase [Streptomyces sp. Osf17]